MKPGGIGAVVTGSKFSIGQSAPNPPLSVAQLLGSGIYNQIGAPPPPILPPPPPPPPRQFFLGAEVTPPPPPITPPLISPAPVDTRLLEPPTFATPAPPGGPGIRFPTGAPPPPIDVGQKPQNNPQTNPAVAIGPNGELFTVPGQTPPAATDFPQRLEEEIKQAQIAQQTAASSLPPPVALQAIPLLPDTLQAKNIAPELPNISPLPAFQLPGLAQIAGQVQGAQAALPPVENFVSRIAEVGRLEQQSITDLLQRQFGQQQQELGRRLAARGIIGGTQEPIFRQLQEQQSFILGNTLSQLSAENQKSQVAELQRVGNISADRANLLFGTIDNRTQLEATQNQQAQIQNRAFQLQEAGLKQDAQSLRLQAQQLATTSAIQQSELLLRQRALDLQAQGLLDDREAGEFSEHLGIFESGLALLQTPGLDDATRAKILDSLSNSLDDLGADFPQLRSQSGPQAKTFPPGSPVPGGGVRTPSGATFVPSNVLGEDIIAL